MMGLGLLVLAGLVWWWSRGLAPGQRLRWLRRAAEAVLVVGALLLLLRGRVDMALLLGGLAASLAVARTGGTVPGWLRRVPGLGPWLPAEPPRLRSALLEIETDARGGVVGGTVCAGLFAGRRLDSLDGPELLALLGLCRRGDPAGLALLEPYLDRRLPGWREHAQRDPDARPAGVAMMTEEEAYKVLGLAAGADAEAVRERHRHLIKRLHPDLGGSADLAARVNLAKDVLLGRHRH